MLATTDKNCNKPKTIRLHVSSLAVGMFICELDRPWLETPFLLQGFEVQSSADVAEVQKYCEYVYIEERRQVTRAPVERVAAKPAARPRVIGKVAAMTPNLSRSRVVHERAQGVTRSILDDIHLNKLIDADKVEATVAECVESIMGDPAAMIWMSRMRSVNERVTEHAMNVMILTITLGRHQGLSMDELHKLGLSALLHDVGKLRLRPELLSKTTRTAEEEAEYREHPRHGQRILLSNTQLYAGAVDVAYTHHEHVDGSGYPRGLTGEQITPFAKMVSICAAYDEITIDGIQGRVLDSVQAMVYLRRHAGKKFEASYVDAFIECIGLFPTGSVVELANGSVGLVVNQNRENKRLPNILVVRGNDKTPCREQIINLGRLDRSGESAPYRIRDILPNGAHGVRLEHYIQKGIKLN